MDKHNNWGGSRKGAGRKTSDPTVQKIMVLPKSLWTKLESVDTTKSAQKNARSILENHFQNINLDSTYDNNNFARCIIKNSEEEVHLSKKRVKIIFESLAPIYMNLKYQVENEENVNERIANAAIALEIMLECIDPDEFHHSFKSVKAPDRFLENFIN